MGAGTGLDALVPNQALYQLTDRAGNGVVIVSTDTCLLYTSDAADE